MLLEVGIPECRNCNTAFNGSSPIWFLQNVWSCGGTDTWPRTDRRYFQIRRSFIYMVMKLFMTYYYCGRLHWSFFLPFTAPLCNVDRGMNKLVIKQGPCGGFRSLLHSKAITIEPNRGNNVAVWWVTPLVGIQSPPVIACGNPKGDWQRAVWRHAQYIAVW